MNELSLFTGAGGGLLGTKLLGFNHIGYVEYNDYCQRILRQRIEDGILDQAPIFGDIRAFISEGYAESYQGVVDVLSAGFPCQPHSRSGKQMAGDDERDMWPATKDCIFTIRPTFCYLENVPGLFDTGYINIVLSDLSASGYQYRYDCIPASDYGADHHRDRLWILAYSSSNGQKRTDETENGSTKSERIKSRGQAARKINPINRIRRHTEPPFLGKYDDDTDWMAQIEAAGNMQVPSVARAAWKILTES